jgi:vacuolar-type H+-ATPase subunit I/STV1
MLASLLHAGIPSIVWTLLLAGLIIWIIFYVLPLPPVVRTILAVVIAVVLVLMLLGGCANGRYIGPPITGSVNYTTPDGLGTVGLSTRLDPSFVSQKK